MWPTSLSYNLRMLKVCVEMPVTPLISNSGNSDRKGKVPEGERDLIFFHLGQLEISGYPLAGHGRAASWTA